MCDSLSVVVTVGSVLLILIQILILILIQLLIHIPDFGPLV